MWVAALAGGKSPQTPLSLKRGFQFAADNKHPPLAKGGREVDFRRDSRRSEIQTCVLVIRCRRLDIQFRLLRQDQLSRPKFSPGDLSGFYRFP